MYKATLIRLLADQKGAAQSLNTGKKNKTKQYLRTQNTLPRKFSRQVKVESLSQLEWLLKKC